MDHSAWGNVVTGKLEAPSWYPPASILKEHEEMGEPLPRVVPAGPDNPLGRYALLLSKKGYLIHGTNKPYGIGMELLMVASGCIRSTLNGYLLRFREAQP